MAEPRRTSELSALTTVQDDDLVMVVEDSDTTMASSGTNKKVTAANTAKYVRSTLPVVYAEDYASPQAAVDAQTGRAVIQFPAGTTAFTTDLDIKQCSLEGVDGSANTTGGGTILTFAGTSRIYSSTENNNNFKIRNMQIEGSATATPWTNSQTLVDATGCNYPELHNVRIRKAQVGLKLANGTGVECHYGKFWLEGIQECNVGVEFGSLAHTHNFYGGRFWSCIKGVSIPSGVQNINFFGTAFECSAGSTAAVESTGTQISFFGCRWETVTTNLSVLSGAGEHWDFAPMHSSGFNYSDANSPSVIYGIGKSSGVNELALLSGAPGFNLLLNGSFEVSSTAATGIADGWTVTQSSSVVHSVSLDAADFTHGLQSQLLSNTSSNNLRIEQMLTVTPNIPHVVRCKIKTTRASTFLRVGNGVSGASTYINQTLTTSGAWVEYRIGFTPTTAAVNVTLYLNGTGAGDVRIDEVSVTPGHLSPPGYPMTARTSAYTQTYATADKTHSNPTAATLTVADGAGTNDNTIGAITADASVIAAVQELADEINKLVADVADVKQLANSVIDDLQSLGLFQ